jgi:hypothetical protein
MLPALRRSMLRIIPVLLLVLAACGGGSLTVEGTLADSTAATEVWAVGRPERVPLANGAFRLERVEGDTLELRFTTGGGSQASMLLHDLPDGGTLRIDGIWFADEVAFPDGVDGGAGGPVVVNGLRMAGSDAIPENANLAGTVLAVADDGDALVLRPADHSLPDVNVLITPAAVVRTIDGDLVDPAQLQFGDSLRVSGIGQGGYVMAAEILVSRRVAANDEDGALLPPARSAGESGNETGAMAVGAAPVPRAAPVREENAKAEVEEGRGKGRGNGRGNARGRG